MSKYEDYSEVSKYYDKDRHAVGVDIIVGLLQVHSGKPLTDLHILDAGCGTGNYAKALIERGVGKVTLMDGNPGMLKVAKEKLKDAIEKNIVVAAVEAKLPELPFEDESFDVILFSLVLHHLEDSDNGGKFPVVEKVFYEAKRVMRSKGIMIVGETLPWAIKKALWYYQLNESLSERFSKLHPSMKQYTAMFDKIGFKIVTKTSVLGSEILGSYYDPKGPLKKEWRNADSVFGFATSQEILDMEQKVREMNNNGTINQFIEEHDRMDEIGMLTLIVCISL